MKKTFILDTNVPIHDTECLFNFQDNDIVLPITVIEELDKLKTGHGEIAYSARQILKCIDRLGDKGDLAKGVPLEGGGSLRIEYRRIDSQLGGLTLDDKIIETALFVRGAAKELQRQSIILVSKDVAVRVKGRALGLEVQDYLTGKTTIFQKYGHVIDGDAYEKDIRSARYVRTGDDIYRIQGDYRQSLVKRGKSVEGIAARNVEQECAIDALLDPSVEIVALTGPAGTGKTLLAIASGLHQVMKKSPLYEMLMVARPIIPLGNDLGYLPGDVNEKLSVWMQPVFDNLDVVMATAKNEKDGMTGERYHNYQFLIDQGILQIEALTYIRGRSLPRRYFIVDEAQNLRPIDAKTIITRCGEGTKIVFTGDLNQIDTPYLDSTSNGLAYLVSRFINEENFCYLNLTKSVRSRLAQQGADLL